MASVPTRELTHHLLYRVISIETACQDEAQSRMQLTDSMQAVALCDRTIQNFDCCMDWTEKQLPVHNVIQQSFEASCKDFLLRVLRVGEIQFKESDHYIRAFSSNVDREIREIDPELIGEKRYDDEDWFFVKIYKWALGFIKHIYFTWMDPYRVEVLTARHDILKWVGDKDLKTLYHHGGFLASPPSSEEDLSYQSCNEFDSLSDLPFTEQDKQNIASFLVDQQFSKIAEIHPLHLIIYVNTLHRLQELCDNEAFIKAFIEKMKNTEELNFYAEDLANALGKEEAVIKLFFHEENWKGLLMFLCQ